MKILAESILTTKDQITVPKVVLQRLDLHAGTGCFGAWTFKAGCLFPADVRTLWKTFGQPLPPRENWGQIKEAYARDDRRHEGWDRPHRPE